MPDGEADGEEADAAEPTDSESAVQRNYELGREVAVTTTRPGGLVKLSVAVAVSDAALEAAAPLTLEELQSLVSVAVGADDARGDQVQVVISAFDSAELPEAMFYEQPWFMMVVRYVTALIAVLLVLFLAVRPLIKRMRDPVAIAAANSEDGAENAEAGIESDTAQGENPDAALGEADRVAAGKTPREDSGQTVLPRMPEDHPHADVPKKVELARQLVTAQPDRAVEALQRMLENPAETLKEAPSS